MRIDITAVIVTMSTDELLELKSLVDYELKRKLNLVSKSIFDIRMSIRLMNVFRANSIKDITELTNITKSDFLKKKNVGKKSLEEAEKILSLYGLKFKRE